MSFAAGHRQSNLPSITLAIAQLLAVIATLLATLGSSWQFLVILGHPLISYILFSFFLPTAQERLRIQDSMVRLQTVKLCPDHQHQTLGVNRSIENRIIAVSCMKY